MYMRLTALGAMLALTLSLTVRAATPTAVINASPISGNAPLAVSLDASLSSSDAISFLWIFGDGAASTAKTVTHIYTVAGNYIVKLTVTNVEGLTNTAQLTITVAGSGAGTVTENVNFRWAITSATFKLNHANSNKSKFQLSAAFNTVDLPSKLRGVAASFSINNLFTLTGIMNEDGVFQNASHSQTKFVAQINPKLQLLTVFISSADLSVALAASGAGNFSAANLFAPITFTLTIGAQTYMVTEKFNYMSIAGASGVGKFNLKKNLGSVQDGFFVISNASAVENFNGTGHFFEFNGFISRPITKLLDLPPASGGKFIIKFNEAQSEALFDRLQRKGNKIIFKQNDRDRGGIAYFEINTLTRRLNIRTWDILADTSLGGTGLPLIGQPFVGFDFTLRLDLDQPDGSTFQAVTATRLTRRTSSDAFWQTGRRVAVKK